MTTKQLSIRLDIDHIKRIEKAAMKNERSRNYAIRKALLKAFPEKKKEK